MKRYEINPREKRFNWGNIDVVVLGDNEGCKTYTYVPYYASRNEKYLEIENTHTGIPKIISSTSSKDWLAFITTKRTDREEIQCYCDKEGYIEIPFVHIVNVEVIVNATKTFKEEEEEIGDYWEYLIKIKEGTWIHVVTIGRKKNYWLYFGEDKVFKVEDEELDLFLITHPEVISLPTKWERIKYTSHPIGDIYEGQRLITHEKFDVKIPANEVENTTYLVDQNFHVIIEQYIESLKKEKKQYCDGDFCFSIQGNIIEYKGAIYLACNFEDPYSTNYTHAIKITKNN